MKFYSMTICCTFKSMTNSGSLENATIFLDSELPKSMPKENAKIICEWHFQKYHHTI